MLKDVSPEKIKKYTKNELNVLCDKLRLVIYDTVTRCGGHLASNLGSVESIVALFYTFDFPNDKIVFDVGHQCYPYKLLSGRYERFSTLRQAGGISGFPKRNESEYDSYDTGHAGTSVSAAIGLAKARDLKGEKRNVIAYIGDGSFNNGLVYEALSSLKIVNTNILIILNDNGMSISPTVGGMYDIIAEIKKNGKEENIRLLESFGLSYVGVKNGNDLEEMLDSVAQAKEMLKNGSVLLHIATKKGKGYEFSEEHPTNTHGIPPVGSPKEKEYSEVLGETLCALAEKDPSITVVSAAMKEALGLSEFFKNYPERAFDVGICEENASVLCASMAAGGLKPYYAIYSTFLQRAFDEIIHDICAQDMPVTMCIDRAGISGADGETHQGVFDLSYLSFIPNMTIAVPKDTEELREMLHFSATYPHPLAIRYPRAGRVLFENGEKTPIVAGKWEYLHKTNSAKATVLAAGERCLIIAMKVLKALEKTGKSFNIVNARFVKPLDTQMLQSIDSEYVVTMEDNVALGGFGMMVNGELLRLNKTCKVKNFAYRDEFIPQGSVSALQSEYGVDCKEIEKYLLEVLL
ncbi:MAG: 1-deoxy-D-xylulose-5-phosphate synthase [Clostridiales bacterium]|nr:1-deoxy-D-xylulose-5-phosphate synthase [Clostridiales bacterium]MBQ2768769.1 1-deoxy-D-xylulose-5-phosphate synthase [Clostridia bacterium]